jgi:hypothetical protein
MIDWLWVVVYLIIYQGITGRDGVLAFQIDAQGDDDDRGGTLLGRSTERIL